uniref:Uncharacterized protein n=1 Tax=Panagrolaimus sp. PS1159 TaxID=55785 RepID=A0AC35F017_9BILA
MDLTKKQQQSFVNDNSSGDTGNQYSNLNLNQNYKSTSFSPVQSNSKSYNDKSYGDSGISDSFEEKNKSKSWNKLPRLCLNSSTLNDKSEEKEGKKKRWEKGDYSNNTNNSTLSLNIAATEEKKSAEEVATAISDSFKDKNVGGHPFTQYSDLRQQKCDIPYGTLDEIEYYLRLNRINQ